ncbi:hypothetical protein Trydic_g8253 [Trypoxylus dichotomus]
MTLVIEQQRSGSRNFLLSLTDEALFGRLKIINNADLKQVVEAKCLELVEKFNVRDQTIHLYLHQLEKAWELKWAPYKLLNGNKLSPLIICSAGISRKDNETFLNGLSTCDERWILYSKLGSYHWLLSTDSIPHTPKASLHPNKI